MPLVVVVVVYICLALGVALRCVLAGLISHRFALATLFVRMPERSRDYGCEAPGAVANSNSTHEVEHMLGGTISGSGVSAAYQLAIAFAACLARTEVNRACLRLTSMGAFLLAGDQRNAELLLDPPETLQRIAQAFVQCRDVRFAAAHPFCIQQCRNAFCSTRDALILAVCCKAGPMSRKAYEDALEDAFHGIHLFRFEPELRSYMHMARRRIIKLGRNWNLFLGEAWRIFNGALTDDQQMELYNAYALCHPVEPDVAGTEAVGAAPPEAALVAGAEAAARTEAASVAGAKVARTDVVGAAPPEAASVASADEAARTGMRAAGFDEADIAAGCDPELVAAYAIAVQMYLVGPPTFQ